MTSLSQSWESSVAQAGCAYLVAQVGVTEEAAVRIQQIPAPTFAEQARGRYVLERFRALGLADVRMDEQANVTGRLRGREPGPGVLVSAHLDTVFPAETDLTARRDGERLWGPGIGDNSMGVAGLLALADALCQTTPRRDLWFAANIGEEGLGNLQGMWTVVRALQPHLGAVVVLEGGAYGVVIHEGIGVQRRRLTVEAAGGHAWSDFGAPSAIHELCRLGAALAELNVPEEPRTSFNLGTIAGGTSVNTIAAHATALLDLRSAAPHSLERLAQEVDQLVSRAQREGVTVRSEAIGARPAGSVPATHPLVQAALASLRRVGHPDPQLRNASTDANVPLTLGIPTVCLGITVGHNAHRLDEYIELPPLKAGLQHCYLTILAALEGL